MPLKPNLHSKPNIQTNKQTHTQTRPNINTRIEGYHYKATVFNNRMGKNNKITHQMKGFLLD